MTRVKVNFKEAYEDRLAQVDIDIRKEVRKKNWALVDMLRAERGKLVDIINRIK
ncbi:hypothetical protein U732_1109 [Clostridium argentinense CDC 2741]|uniref:Uncharacterized protein n=1 Tax=Clostridium argentinense CDC 2741 TaxID=1418104 RepID=A0A0C1R153_9CLOT|nr:hypothetical protein [Clostridium argentinense]KIE47112.1 hypothetical protein U732_1109 [Clostridium argentinense CDC 2741]